MPTKFSSAARVIFVALIYAAGYAVIQIAAAMVFGFLGALSQGRFSAFSDCFTSTLFFSTAAAMVAAMALYILFGRLRERRLGEELRFSSLRGSCIRGGVLLALGCRLAVTLYSSFAKLIPVLSASMEAAADSYAAALDTPAKIVLALVISNLLAPIFEEILFRGFIQSELLRGLPPKPAIAAGALIFAAAHGILFQSIFTFFVGLALGWCYYRTKSLYTSIIFHIVFNVSSIFFDSIPLSLDPAAFFLAGAIFLIFAGCSFILLDTE